MNEILDALQDAAHAVGYEVACVGDDGDSLMIVGIQEPWCPHRDDGQAFRLAIKARIDVRLAFAEHYHAEFTAWLEGNFDASDEAGNDEAVAAAMRMAIMKVAAGVGRIKKQWP